MSNDNYKEPLVLTIISSISIGVAAIFSAYIAIDILRRLGWQSMMAIMIPVYIINALYLWPITLWAYLKYSRPDKPLPKKQVQHEQQLSQNSSRTQVGLQQNQDSHESHNSHGGHEHNHDGHKGDVEGHEQHERHDGLAHHHGGGRSMFATVTIGVCHCGAGCVLGDIIGEWIVYGTGATLGNPPRDLWVNYLVGKSWWHRRNLLDTDTLQISLSLSPLVSSSSTSRLPLWQENGVQGSCCELYKLML